MGLLTNMRKTGTYATATSLRLFHDVTKGPISSIRLSVEEEFWITKAITAGSSIIWSEPYESSARQCDVDLMSFIILQFYYYKGSSVTDRPGYV